MPSVKLRDVKKGEAIMYKGEVWVVFDRHEQTRGNLRTYWQVELKNLERGNVFKERFSPDDNVDKVNLNREEYEFLYQDSTNLIFMHPESFEQLPVNDDLIPAEQRGYLVPNLRVQLCDIDGKVVQVQMPLTVEVEITDAPDAARGDTATSVTKLATIETGAEIKVPAHIKKGDKVKVRVEDGEFLGRV